MAGSLGSEGISSLWSVVGWNMTSDQTFPITVYGASDDLIEVEGLLDEEFSCYGEDTAYLGFSNGVLLEIRYDDENWRIRPVRGQSQVTIEFAPENEENGYSDKAHLHQGATWVVFGSNFAVER